MGRGAWAGEHGQGSKGRGAWAGEHGQGNMGRGAWAGEHGQGSIDTLWSYYHMPGTHSDLHLKKIVKGTKVEC